MTEVEEARSARNRCHRRHNISSHSLFNPPVVMVKSMNVNLWLKDATRIMEEAQRTICENNPSHHL